MIHTARRKWMKPLAIFCLLACAAGPAEDGGYTADGKLIPPLNYREWVFLGSGLDMSYTKSAPMADHSMFDNVFVDPQSWHSFQATGQWPEKTMFVMEARGAASHGSINQHGQYQTADLMGAEVHVHDSKRFQGGWGFFVLDGAAPAKLVGHDAACYACHQAHGAVQTTFTQFYPTAKPIAVAAGNYRER